MKKNGFTLIELLGSIVILVLISLIAFPVVLDFMSSSNDKKDSAMKEAIISSAREYVSDNVNDFNKTSSLNKKVNTSVLIDDGYITNRSIINNEDLNTSCVIVTFVSNNYKYTFSQSC